MQRRLAVAFVLLIALAGLAVLGGAVDASDGDGPETTPIDVDPDDSDDPDAERPLPSEPVPFGVRTTYGQSDLERPSGGAGVTVAVLDTGVDRTHPDLRDRVTLCRDFTGERVREGCSDVHGHGTHVAGTVAADGGRDGRGIYGVAPAAEVYAFRTCDAEGRCPTEPLQRAVRAATDEGADVVVLSLGGRSEPRVETATQYAAENGVLVVAATGNAGPDVGSILYPAAHPHVVGVAAVGPLAGERVEPGNYRVPEFSGRGVDEPFAEGEGHVEVAGPGVDVLSPVPDDEYATMTGTSMAAPHVAGLAAKVLASEAPPETSAELRAELRDRAPRFDVAEGPHARSGYDPAAGFGVPTTEPPTAAFTVDPDPPRTHESFALDGGDSTTGDAEIAAYAWDTTGDGEVDRRGKRVEVERPAGTVQVTLHVTDADGASDEVTRSVTVADRQRTVASWWRLIPYLAVGVLFLLGTAAFAAGRTWLD